MKGKGLKMILSALMSVCMTFSFASCGVSDIIKDLVNDAGIADWFSSENSESETDSGASGSGNGNVDSSGGEIGGVCEHVFDEDGYCIYCGGHVCEYTELTEVLSEATCTEDGEGKYACPKCGAVDILPIPATGHDFGIVTVSSTTCFNGCGLTYGEWLAQQEEEETAS